MVGEKTAVLEFSSDYTGDGQGDIDSDSEEGSLTLVADFSSRKCRQSAEN